MFFLYATALSFGPVLVAILAAALILPRAWLMTYATFVIAAIIIYSDHSGRHDDAAFGNIFSALFCVLALVALVAGLLTRWALKPRAPRGD